MTTLLKLSKRRGTGRGRAVTTKAGAETPTGLEHLETDETKRRTNLHMFGTVVKRQWGWEDEAGAVLNSTSTMGPTPAIGALSDMLRQVIGLTEGVPSSIMSRKRHSQVARLVTILAAEITRRAVHLADLFDGQ